MTDWGLHELGAWLGVAVRVEGMTVWSRLAPGTAEAKYLKDDGYGHVRLQVTAAPQFGVRLSYAWPEEVGARQAEEFDRAILEGILRAVLACGVRELLAVFECDRSSYAPGVSVPHGYKVAAGMAMQQLLQDRRWAIMGSWDVQT